MLCSKEIKNKWNYYHNVDFTAINKLEQDGFN